MGGVGSFPGVLVRKRQHGRSRTERVSSFLPCWKKGKGRSTLYSVLRMYDIIDIQGKARFVFGGCTRTAVLVVLRKNRGGTPGISVGELLTNCG